MKINNIDAVHELPLMDFGIIRVVGKQAFYDWMNAQGNEIVMQIKEDFDHGLSFLVSDEWVEEHVLAFMKCNYLEIFEHMLFGWCTDDDDWPTDRSWKVFCEWFEWSYNSVVFGVEE